MFERGDVRIVGLQPFVPPAVLGREHRRDEYLVDRRVKAHPRKTRRKGTGVLGEMLGEVGVLEIAQPVWNAEMAKVGDRRDADPVKLVIGLVRERPVVSARA